MKRKNLAALATMMVCMTAGCAGNMNSPAVQAAPAPSASVAETTMEEPQSEQENSSSGAMETSAVADGQTEAPIQESAVSAGPEETAQQDSEKTAARIQANHYQTVMETAPGSISMETAKSIAMKDAGISGESVSYSSAKLDWDDGRQVYDVDFFSVGIEYEYEILASDGTILKKKQDAEWGKNSGTPAGHVAGQTGVSGTLTMEQARQKVAERIPGVDPAGIYIKEDYDDGRLKYEGEVYYNQTKYEFELDAATGAFTDWEEEKGR